MVLDDDRIDIRWYPSVPSFVAVVAGLMKTFRLAYLAGKRLYLSNVTRGVILLNQLKVEK
jgi:hypothetical protein